MVTGFSLLDRHSYWQNHKSDARCSHADGLLTTAVLCTNGHLEVSHSMAAIVLYHYPLYDHHTCRVDDCKDTLKRLSGIADEADDLRGQALYDCCQFDALLELGETNLACTGLRNPFQILLSCTGYNQGEASKLVTAAESCCEEDIYHFDNIERFFLVSCLALW